MESGRRIYTYLFLGEGDFSYCYKYIVKNHHPFWDGDKKSVFILTEFQKESDLKKLYACERHKNSNQLDECNNEECNEECIVNKWNSLNTYSKKNPNCIKIIFKFEFDARKAKEQYESLKNTEEVLRNAGNPNEIIFNFPYFIYRPPNYSEYVTTHDLLDDILKNLKEWNGLQCDLRISYLLNNDTKNDNNYESPYLLNMLHKKYNDSIKLYKRMNFDYLEGYIYRSSKGDRIGCYENARTYVYKISKYTHILLF